MMLGQDSLALFEDVPEVEVFVLAGSNQLAWEDQTVHLGRQAVVGVDFLEGGWKEEEVGGQFSGSLSEHLEVTGLVNQ